MKKSTVILFIILVIYFFKNDSFGRTADSRFESSHLIRSDTADIEERLLKFKYKKYINKPIGELLKGINLDYRKIMFIQMKPFYLEFVSVIYSDNLRLDIYTEKYDYLKRLLNENETEEVWKIEDLLKERVTKVRVRTRAGKSLKECPRKPNLPII